MGSVARMTGASVDKYLEFLGFKGFKEPTLENLINIHQLHLYKVTFENVSCMVGEEIQLNIDWLFDKVVNRSRGGFCFELNGLFHWLLSSLGYQVRMVSAAVAAPTPTGFSFPLDHMLNVVTLGDSEFLCDVGFGKHTFITPMPIKVGVHRSGSGLHRLVGEEDGGVVLQKLAKGGKWHNTCKINLDSERKYEDFLEQCRYHQFDESAYMAGNNIACKFFPNGEVRTMLGRSFRRYSSVTETGETVETKDDLSDEEVNEILKKEFGLALAEDIKPRRFDPSSFNV